MFDRRCRVALTAALTLLSFGCSRGESPEALPADAAPAAPAAVAPASAALPGAAEEQLPPEPTPDPKMAQLVKSWTGDYDEMIERRAIRVLVTWSKTHYFVDRGTPRGMVYEMGKMLEDDINADRGNLRVFVAFIPVAHDELIPALLDGRGDVAAANLTITPERLARVDFTNPVFDGVDEIVVTAPGQPPLASAEELSGREVYIRRSSSFYSSVVALNERLRAAGKPPVAIREAPEVLADEDILEMVNAGLVPATVIDDHIGEFWAKVFDKMVLNTEATVRTGGQVALMIRKNSPQLRAALDAFLARHPKGGADRNVLLQRYLRNTKYAADATSDTERKKFEQTVELFRRYSDEYSLDYLLMMAQSYQESRLDQNARSQVGAVGIMQIMPATGQDLKVGDITQLEPNIHGGVKYIRFLIDQYFANEPMTQLDKGLFAFAAYNAGPGRIRQLRKRAADRGLDPNKWFNNVEVVAAEAIGRETVQYVSNIYKYYLAYTMLVERRREADAAKATVAGQPVKER